MEKNAFSIKQSNFEGRRIEASKYPVLSFTQELHFLSSCALKNGHKFWPRMKSGWYWGKYRWNFACVSISHKWPSLRVYLVFRGLVSDTFVFRVNVNEQRRRTCVFIESSYSSHVWYRSHGRNQTVLVYRMVQFVKHFRRSSAISSDYNPNLIRSRSLNELNKGLGTRENRQSFLLHCTLVQNIFKLNIKIMGTFLYRKIFVGLPGNSGVSLPTSNYEMVLFQRKISEVFKIFRALRG